MRIRSVTAFADVTYPLESDGLKEAGDLLGSVRRALGDAGFEVETIRLATQPFPAALEDAGPARAVDLAKDLEAIGFVHEIDYIALGPVRLGDPVAHFAAMADVFEATSNVFASVEIASRGQGVSLPRVRRAAELIRRVASISPDGFANLRLAALANTGPWSPFFPAAYHGGGALSVAIATESADLAVTAITGSDSLAAARDSLVRSIETDAARIEGAVKRAAGAAGATFRGVDFSLAPHPEQGRSVSAALEALAAILVDVGALALRLDKPLTARLMPLPGKAAGDETDFEFEYFANSRVIAPLQEPLRGLLAGDESIQLQSLAGRE